MIRHSRWMGRILAVTAAGLTIGLGTVASAQEIRNDVQDRRQDRRELREDRQDRRHDVRDLRQDRRELRRDVADRRGR